MIRSLILTLLIAGLPCETAECTPIPAQVYHVNGERFVAVGYEQRAIFLPTDTLLTPTRRMELAFCDNHITKEEVIFIKAESFEIDPEELKKLARLCGKAEPRKHIPQWKPGESHIPYDHSSAQAWMGLIQLLTTLPKPKL